MDYLATLDKKKSDQSQAKQHKEGIAAFETLAGELRTLLSSLDKTGAKKLDKDFIAAVGKLSKVVDAIGNIRVSSDDEIRKALDTLSIVLRTMDIKPTVNVAPTPVTVEEREIDLQPLIKVLKTLETKAPKVTVNVDNDEVTKGLEKVHKAINGLSFPVPNYVLPYSKDGKASQVVLDSSGNVPVSGAVTVASLPLPTGAATSANQTDGSQLTQIVDSGGEPVTVTGGKLDVNATISGTGGGTASVDDAAFAVGIDTGTPTMSLFDDVAPDSINEGDVGVTRMSANRNAYTTIRDAAGNERGVNVTAGNALTVDASATTQPVSGTVTANIGTVATLATASKQDTGNASLSSIDGKITAVNTGAVTISSALPAGANNIGDVDVLTVNGIAPAFGSGARSASTQRVTIATDDSVPVTGTFWQATQPVSGTVTANLSATDNNVLDSIDVSTASKYITGIGHGVKTVTTAGTDVALASSTACKTVTIQSQTDNTGLIAVGASGVDATEATGTGIILYPGDYYEFDIDNLADIFIDSTVSGEGVRFTYFT